MKMQTRSFERLYKAFIYVALVTFSHFHYCASWLGICRIH